MYWHIGGTAMRLRRDTPLSLNCSNNADIYSSFLGTGRASRGTCAGWQKRDFLAATRSRRRVASAPRSVAERKSREAHAPVKDARVRKTSSAAQRREQGFGNRLRRSRVLARDQQAVGCDVRLPVGGLRVLAAVGLQHVFDEERHDVGQLHGGFFVIRKTGDRFAGHE